MEHQNHPHAELLTGLDAVSLEALVQDAEAELRRRKGLPDALPQHRPCQARSFLVPEHVKHLHVAELEALTAGFRAWTAAASHGRQRQARTRVLMVYLLLRFTGMKLGEVLALDDRTDLDVDKGLVHVRRSKDGLEREVPIPEWLARELRAMLDDPMFFRLRGSVLALDPGGVRRRFYEMAAHCGMPKLHVNPQVIRTSRAVELLRNGVPIPLVQTILGHKDVAMTAQYVLFSETQSQRILEHVIKKEAAVKVSARNTFPGVVASVRSGNILSEVVLDTAMGVQVVAIITHESMKSLNLGVGMPATAMIKAPWVVLVKEDAQVRTSARNQFCGTVSAVHEGQISAEVVVSLPGGATITSMVTDESIQRLGIAVGDAVCALFKAFSVIISVE